MSEEKKYSIFFIKGGKGKHVAATAVAKCIKNNHPNRRLIVVCAWTSIFINLDFVDRVYRRSITPYFYQDYIEEKDSLIFKHEPYYTTDHIHKKKHLIENWCNLYDLEYKGETPQINFNMQEKLLADSLWGNTKPIMVLQTGGGDLNDGSPYKWSRDMPVGIIDEVIKRFNSAYKIYQVTTNNGYVGEGVTHVNKEHTTMELSTLVALSQKRVLIDSCLQHIAGALGKPSTVLWIGTDPKVFGYPIHDNIRATEKKGFNLPDSTLFDYSFEGLSHECPYRSEEEMFNLDEIIDSIKKQ